MIVVPAKSASTISSMRSESPGKRVAELRRMFSVSEPALSSFDL